jgi:hypothetical protein
MTIVEKIIPIPADGRIRLDMELVLPKEFANKDAKFRINISPVLSLTEDMPLSAFYGCLEHKDVFTEDSVQIQRKLRDEW